MTCTSNPHPIHTYWIMGTYFPPFTRMVCITVTCFSRQFHAAWITRACFLPAIDTRWMQCTCTSPSIRTESWVCIPHHPIVRYQSLGTYLTVVLHDSWANACYPSLYGAWVMDKFPELVVHEMIFAHLFFARLIPYRSCEMASACCCKMIPFGWLRSWLMSWGETAQSWSS